MDYQKTSSMPSKPSSVDSLKRNLLEVEQALEQQLQETRNYRQTLESGGLAALLGGVVQSSLPAQDLPIPDAREYAAYGPAKALEVYLRHPDRQRQKIPLDRIVSDLLRGGFLPKFGTPGHKPKVPPSQTDLLYRSLKRAINSPQRTVRLFETNIEGRLSRVDPSKILVWLSESAFQPPPRRSRKS